MWLVCTITAGLCDCGDGAVVAVAEAWLAVLGGGGGRSGSDDGDASGQLKSISPKPLNLICIRTYVCNFNSMFTCHMHINQRALRISFIKVLRCAVAKDLKPRHYHY